jgi:hypothetical protein
VARGKAFPPRPAFWDTQSYALLPSAHARAGQAPGEGVPGHQVRSMRPRGAHGARMHEGGQHALLRVRRKRPHLTRLSCVSPRPCPASLSRRFHSEMSVGSRVGVFPAHARLRQCGGEPFCPDGALCHTKRHVRTAD